MLHVYASVNREWRAGDSKRYTFFVDVTFLTLAK